jgi:hypothetical protein
MTRVHLTIQCATPTCQSRVTFQRDDHLPLTWTCPACEDALEEQRINAIAPIGPAPYNFDRPLFRVNFGGHRDNQ